MKFSKSVIKFNIKNISVIGNFENGGLIGLTEDGKQLCEKIDAGVISEEQAMNENKELFYNTKWRIVELSLVLAITFLTSISLGILLAGLTIKFRKTETLLNLINIMVLIELIMPFTAMSSNAIYIISAILPFSGTIVCIQNVYNEIANLNEIYLLFATISNLLIIIVFSNFVFNKCMKCAKTKGDLGNY